MKVLLVNGSPNPQGCTYTALHEVETTLQRHGIGTELLYLGKQPVAGCIACMKCFETGHCFRDDAVRGHSEPAGRVRRHRCSDRRSITAVRRARSLSFCQRLFFCKEGELAGKLGASVVSCRRGWCFRATFEQLNQFFTIANMPVVSSQYWNSVHGFTPDDVRRDREGTPDDAYARREHGPGC